MLSAIAVRAGELLAVAGVAGLVLVAAAAAGVWWLRRRARRGLQALGRIVAGRARRAAAGRASTGSRWLLARPLPGRRSVAAGRARRQLWRAVSAAEHAVARARDGGAPVGDLEGLCRRLRTAAADADRSLTIAGRATAAGCQPESASSQAGGLVSAAGQIQGAAAAALASMSRPVVSSLADDVSREVVALSAGMASAASSGPGGLPGETL
jgi:hypothetical protein